MQQLMVQQFMSRVLDLTHTTGYGHIQQFMRLDLAHAPGYDSNMHQVVDCEALHQVMRLDLTHAT